MDLNRHSITLSGLGPEISWVQQLHGLAIIRLFIIWLYIFYNSPDTDMGLVRFW